MYYKKFIEFLKEHHLYDEKMFKYWYDNSIRFDYRQEEGRSFINTFYIFKKKKLDKIWSFVPFIDDDITVLINIHEYVHFFLLYNKLGKKYTMKKDCEVLPVFFEKIYIDEYRNSKLSDYYDNLNEFIVKEQKEEYLLALELIDDLTNYYDNQSIDKLNSKVKRLVLNNDIKKTFNI